MKVKECMCDDVCCVKPETKINEVAKLMSSNHIGCVPVCDNNNKICGIVTDRDILLRSIANDKDVKQTPVSDIMTCNVCSCDSNEEMSNVESKMVDNQVRRMPVLENGKIIGVLTIGDLINHDCKLGKKEVFNTIDSICDCTDNRKNAQ